MASHLINRHDRSKHMVTSAYCGCWGCERCRPILELKWVDHVTQLFPKYETLYSAVVPKQLYMSTTRRIRRDKGDYLSVEHLAGYYLVITPSSQINGRRVIGDIVSPDQAIKLFTDALRASPARGRPVSTSDGWSRKLVGPPSESEWQKVEGVSVPAVEVADCIRASGYAPQWFWGAESYGFVFNIPEGQEVSIRSMMAADGINVSVR